MLKNLLLVFVGGGLGSSLRYLTSVWLSKSNVSIPYPTLSVNIIGSLLLGIVLGWALRTDSLNSPLVALIGIGFCGGFTTFSSFALENQAFLKSGDYTYFLIYSLGSIFFGILAAFAGMFIAKFI